MKNKLTNAFNSILAFVKKHSIGTVVIALLITAVIVALACKDTTEVAPGDKNAVSDVSTSSSEGNDSQDAVSSEEQEPVSSQEAASSDAAASTDNTASKNETTSQESASSKQESVASENNNSSKNEALESSSKQEAVQKPKEEVKKEESVPVATIQEPATGADPNPMKTYEENKKKHENEVKEYLKENSIDPSTAGETGEFCPGCGKKIWDNNKYGLNNPGMPDDYENSGYCTGWCTVQVG